MRQHLGKASPWQQAARWGTTTFLLSQATGWWTAALPRQCSSTSTVKGLQVDPWQSSTARESSEWVTLQSGQGGDLQLQQLNYDVICKVASGNPGGRALLLGLHGTGTRLLRRGFRWCSSSSHWLRQLGNSSEGGVSSRLSGLHSCWASELRCRCMHGKRAGRRSFPSFLVTAAARRHNSVEAAKAWAARQYVGRKAQWGRSSYSFQIFHHGMRLLHSQPWLHNHSHKISKNPTNLQIIYIL